MTKAKSAPSRDPVRIAGWWLRWAAFPAFLGIFLSGQIELRALPLVAGERLSAVLLLDGQAYFGHLDDSGESGTLFLRDVYYFQEDKGGGTGLPVGLVKRGGEAHEPADGMQINRDRVLAVERVGADSAVARAIDAEREIARATVPFFSLNRQAIGDAGTLAAQRTAAEHDLARGFAANVDTLNKLNDLVLPVSKADARTITAKAIDDLRTVRRSALAAIAKTLGLGAADADSYVRLTDAQLEAQTFAGESGVLLAPDLYAIVQRAGQLYAQAVDQSSKQLTRSTPSPSPSPAPPGAPGSASPTPAASPSH